MGKTTPDNMSLCDLGAFYRAFYIENSYPAFIPVMALLSLNKAYLTLQPHCIMIKTTHTLATT